MFMIVDPCLHLLTTPGKKISSAYKKYAKRNAGSYYANVCQYKTAPSYNKKYSFFYIKHSQPAKTSGDPAATAVQVGSPTLPQAELLTNTDEDPAPIGTACPGQGLPGRTCPELGSPTLDIPIPFTNTFPDAAALTIPEQCATSASPNLVIAGIFLSFLISD